MGPPGGGGMSGLICTCQRMSTTYVYRALGQCCTRDSVLCGFERCERESVAWAATDTARLRFLAQRPKRQPQVLNI